METLLLYINSVRTAQETNIVAIRKTKLLMQFRELMTVYSDNRMKRIKRCVGKIHSFFYVKAGGTYNYQYASQGYRTLCPFGSSRLFRLFGLWNKMELNFVAAIKLSDLVLLPAAPSHDTSLQRID
jgi:hypothetical protein